MIALYFCVWYIEFKKSDILKTDRFFAALFGLGAAFSRTPRSTACRLLGGVRGGNSTKEQLERQIVLTTHKYNSHLSWRGLSLRIRLDSKIKISHHTCRLIVQRQSVLVDTHGGENRIPEKLCKRLVRLVYGRNKLLRDGTRSSRHTVHDAVDIINDDAKFDSDHISLRSGYNILHNAGLFWKVRRRGPAVTEQNRQARIAYRERHRHRDAIGWQTICFSDSTCIGPDHRHNRHNDGLWLKKGDPCPPTQKLRRPDSNLHCYCAITRHGITTPIFIEGSITADRYISEVLPHLLREIKRLVGDEPFIFQQDGAGAHRAKKTQRYLVEQGVTFIPYTEWPGNSPDLNPIEGFWPLLQNTCAPPGQKSLSKELLKKRARRWARSVTAEQCRDAQDSCMRRLEELDESEGWAIPR